MREETRCRHMGYSLRLTARVLLNAPSRMGWSQLAGEYRKSEFKSKMSLWVSGNEGGASHPIHPPPPLLPCIRHWVVPHSNNPITPKSHYRSTGFKSQIFQRHFTWTHFQVFSTTWSSVVRAFARDAMGSSQCSTTGVTKVVVCAILSVGWCI